MEGAAEADVAAMTAQVQPKKGDKGLPKGVTPVQSRRAGAPIKYQARIACKADGEKKAKQRGLGTFDSVSEAAAVVQSLKQRRWLRLRRRSSKRASGHGMSSNE